MRHSQTGPLFLLLVKTMFGVGNCRRGGIQFPPPYWFSCLETISDRQEADEQEKMSQFYTCGRTGIRHLREPETPTSRGGREVEREHEPGDVRCSGGLRVVIRRDSQ